MFCDKDFLNKKKLLDHLDNEHYEQLNGKSPSQIYFNYKYKKEGGSCVICGKPTKWSEVLQRYERFHSEECKNKYVDIFKKRMVKKYGKENILDEPAQQLKMLASRKISGIYISESKYKHSYTGTYEKKFLEFLDIFMKFPPNEVITPSPQIFYYKVENKKKFYIPDFFFPSLNLIVEIKSFENKHYRERDKYLEELKEKAVLKENVNFLVINDNKFEIFVDYLNKQKKNL